jgi:TolA-binding protein
MKVTTFLSFILVLTLGWMQFYSAVRERFNGVQELKSQVASIKSQKEQRELELALDREQFLEFRQSVATLMPDVLREKGLGEEGYPFRSLASTITRSEAMEVKKTIAKTLFERGKSHFRSREYAKAIKVFKQVIDRFGFSTHVAEAYFLMAESQFQENELEECTTTIKEMVELFPQHELTGFSLIRLGRIYELQNRNEEAIDIYRTVMRSYPQRDVASQAKASMRGLDQ